MSQRDRGFIAAAFLIAGGTLTLFFMVWIVGLNYCPGSPCKYHAGSGQNPAQQNQESLRWLPFAFGPNTTDQPGPDDQESSEKYYTRQDLRAQESVARATNAIVILTAISIVIGTVGVASVVVTIYLNVKAVTTANEANRIARTDQRPWVTVRWKTPCKFEVSEDGRTCYIRWRFDFENMGKSPAFLVRQEWHVYRFNPIFVGSGSKGIEDITEKAKRSWKQMGSKPILFPNEKTNHDRSEGRLTITGDDTGSFMLCTCLTYALNHGETEFGTESRVYIITPTDGLKDGNTHRLLRDPFQEGIETIRVG